MKKVLVVEDYDPYYATVEKGLAGKVELMRAETLSEGRKLFQENPDVDLIIMDACVPGDKPNSMPLVAEIVESGYDKPIIASSSIPFYTRKLVEAGATHGANKYEVPELALDLLGL